MERKVAGYALAAGDRRKRLVRGKERGKGQLSLLFINQQSGKRGDPSHS